MLTHKKGINPGIRKHTGMPYGAISTQARMAYPLRIIPGYEKRVDAAPKGCVAVCHRT